MPVAAFIAFIALVYFVSSGKLARVAQVIRGG